MATVIRAENIGKKYRISHEAQGQRFRYKTLGETAANVGKSIWHGMAHPFQRTAQAQPRAEDFWTLKDITMKSNKATGLALSVETGPVNLPSKNTQPAGSPRPQRGK